MRPTSVERRARPRIRSRPRSASPTRWTRNNLYYFTYAKGFRPGGGNNPRAVCRLRRRLPSLRHSRCAADLRLGHRQQLRGRREEQFQQPRQDRQQRLLHPVEQHPADRGAAGLPDFVHLESGQGDRQGPGHAGRNRAHRRFDGGTDGRLHRRALHQGFALDRRSGQIRADRAATAMPSPARAASPARRSPPPLASSTSSRSSITNRSFASTMNIEGRAKWPSPGQDPRRRTAVRFGELCAVVDQLRLGARRHELRRMAGRGVRRQSHRHATPITNYNWTIDPGDGDEPPAAPVHIPSAHRGPVVHLPPLGPITVPRSNAWHGGGCAVFSAVLLSARSYLTI